MGNVGKTVFQVNADLQGLQMAHFAFQAQATGWIALALTARPGRMYPADAVLGYVNPDGQGSVQSFYLRNNFPTFNDAFGGWAAYMGVVQASGSTWVCFSRRLVEPTAPAVKNIATDGNENGGRAVGCAVLHNLPAPAGRGAEVQRCRGAGSRPGSQAGARQALAPHHLLARCVHPLHSRPALHPQAQAQTCP